MAASADRNPPPFPAAEETEAGLDDMADGDSDEGEDIFVNKVLWRLGPLEAARLFLHEVKSSGPQSQFLYLI